MKPIKVMDGFYITSGKPSIKCHCDCPEKDHIVQPFSFDGRDVIICKCGRCEYRRERK